MSDKPDEMLLYKVARLCGDAHDDFLLAWHVKALLEIEVSVAHEPKAVESLREAAKLLGFDLVKYPTALVAAIAERANG